MQQRRDNIFITDDLDSLLEILPPAMEESLRQINRGDQLLEVVLDLGRPPEARFVDGEVKLRPEEVQRRDLEHVVAKLSAFDADNRAGIERTLHRIAAIRNRYGDIIGLTCRVGRAVYGTIEIVRDVVESGQSILFLGRPGVGKCVTADSLLFTAEGMLSLATWVPRDLAADVFVERVISLEGANGLEYTSHLYSGGEALTVAIASSQGFVLEGTPEHPIMVMAENGDLVFRPLNEIAPGDYVVIQRGQDRFGNQLDLPAFDFVPRTNALNHPVPTRMSRALARFLGYLVAEGTLTYDNQVTFSNTDAEVQEDMTRLTETLFSLEFRPHLHAGKWNGKDFRIFGVKLRRFLTGLGLGKGNAASKSVPPCITCAPREIVTEFLRAYFEGDGSIYKPGRIEISSASALLMWQIHIILLNFGIVANLRTTYNQSYKRHYYRLGILGHNVDRFAQSIGFISTTKQSKLARFTGGYRNPNLDVIPHIRSKLEQLKEAAKGGVGPTLARFTRRDERRPSYRSLGKILAETAKFAALPVYQSLQAIHESAFYFDVVSEKRTGRKQVYDLTVPGSHTFFANGFINHNTTMLREAARVLAEKKRVVVVDTSNEIGGGGDIPHPAIGRARRMQVPTPTLQHEVMIEAVENHMPEVVVIDEIGRELEAAAARTIAERGVQLVATAHGTTLDNLIMNPTLADLVGGIESVTLSDEEARRRGTQKSILERKAPPTFDVVIELQDWHTLAIHHDVSMAVDAILRKQSLPAETRYRDEDGEIHVEETVKIPAAFEVPRSPHLPNGEARPARVFPYGVGLDNITAASANLHVPVVIVKKLQDADVVITVKNMYRKRAHPLVAAEKQGVPIHVLRSNTVTQVEKCLADIFNMDVSEGGTFSRAMSEARIAIAQVLAGTRRVELSPQNAEVRRKQHQIAREANLVSYSRGKEPRRRVTIARK